METRRKPRLLIIGHGEHGKDAFAELISKRMGLAFTSSSMFVGQRAIWPYWGKERYMTFDEMFDDRKQHREVWGNLISAYCTPNKCRTAEEMFELGNDMYVGMRRVDEYDACMAKSLFDHVIWVDASNRMPLEPLNSMQMNRDHADMYIDNNGPQVNMNQAAINLQELLHREGFDVAYQEPHMTLEPVKDEHPTLGARLEWTDKPENSTQVLDHGFIEVKEVMGSDAAIAGSARMSYGRGTKSKNTDEGLINYLVRNHHTSPLEMGEIRFHMRLPIFVMRQLIRQRTANVNEYSGRYSEMVRLFYVPELDQVMCQGTVNKQMSGLPLPPEQGKMAQQCIYEMGNNCFDAYEDLLKIDVSRETARMVLPLNTYTECVWKLDISNLIKFLYLRDDDHAQWEIRQFAKHIGEAVQHHFPAVHAAYMRTRNSVSLTKEQIIAIIDRDVSGLSKSEAKAVSDILEAHEVPDVTY